MPGGVSMSCGRGSGNPMVPSLVEGLARGGDAPALVFPNDWVISYADLARRVDRQAALFGTGKRLVAVDVHRSEQAVVAYRAALKAGPGVVLLPTDALRADTAWQADLQHTIRCPRVRARRPG